MNHLGLGWQCCLLGMLKKGSHRFDFVYRTCNTVLGFCAHHRWVAGSRDVRGTHTNINQLKDIWWTITLAKVKHIRLQNYQKYWLVQLRPSFLTVE
jgi:hypothetical protein